MITIKPPHYYGETAIFLGDFPDSKFIEQQPFCKKYSLHV